MNTAQDSLGLCLIDLSTDALWFAVLYHAIAVSYGILNWITK